MSDVVIGISGSNESTRTVVGSIIEESLVDAGFLDIVHINQNDEVVDISDNRSMLDILKEQNPTLFETEITICHIDTNEDNEANETLPDTAIDAYVENVERAEYLEDR